MNRSFTPEINYLHLALITCTQLDCIKMSSFRRLVAGITQIAITTGLGGAALLPAITPAQAKSNFDPVVIDICQHTMRTVPGTSEEGACLDSLAATAAFNSTATATQQARHACEAKGIADQGAAMAMCIVDTRRRGAAPALLIDPSLVRTSANPYTRMSFKDQRQAEEQSCATLGLQPDSGGFQSCVQTLDSALFDADNPER